MTMNSSQCSDHRRWLGLLGQCLFLAVFHIMSAESALKAKPCLPSDPDNGNPGNLCLTYPTHGMSLNSDSFRQGFASEGYYGTPTGPRWPGEPIQPGHTPRTPMDKQPSQSGYWTRIDASGGESRVQTNTGKNWSLRLQN